MNIYGIRAIYMQEVSRMRRTLIQSILIPVITTSLYFLVFGSAMGEHMGNIGDISYGAYIIPGLVMMSLLNESISNSSFGIYMPRFTGAIYEVLSAPLSNVEVVIGYVCASVTKCLLVGLLILLTARLFVPYDIEHPLWMLCFLLLTSITFSLFGFIVGLWADSFEKLQVIPFLVVMPLTFLGGSFYSISMLPPVWQTVTLFNPVLYLVSGFRWSFYGTSDMGVHLSLMLILAFLVLFSLIIVWMFRTGYGLKD